MKSRTKLIQYPFYILPPDSEDRDTVDRVTWQVRHELDLFEEGQVSDLTPETAQLARKFLAKHAPHLLAI